MRTVLLHGLGGGASSWRFVMPLLEALDGELVALDLLGHAGRLAPADVCFGDLVIDVRARVDGPCRVVGFSLGGSVALDLALRHPAVVAELVLVAATAGVSDPRLRIKRRHSAATNAQRLVELGVGRYADERLRLYSSPTVAQRWREDFVRNRPDALAAVMRGTGSGSRPALWQHLAKIRSPTVVIVGEHDDSARDARRTPKSIPMASFIDVRDAGHDLPLEAQRRSRPSSRPGS